MGWNPLSSSRHRVLDRLAFVSESPGRAAVPWRPRCSLSPVQTALPGPPVVSSPTLRAPERDLFSLLLLLPALLLPAALLGPSREALPRPSPSEPFVLELFVLSLCAASWD